MVNNEQFAGGPQAKSQCQHYGEYKQLTPNVGGGIIFLLRYKEQKKQINKKTGTLMCLRGKGDYSSQCLKT